MENYSASVYTVASPHICNCAHCPQRSLSPTSSNDSHGSIPYTPNGTPEYPPAIPYDIALDAAPTRMPSDTQVEQLIGWEPVAPHDPMPYGTPIQEAARSWIDHGENNNKLPMMLPVPPERPEFDFSWLDNGKYASPGLSNPTSKVMVPAHANNRVYNPASYHNLEVEAAGYNNTNQAQSLPSAPNVQFSSPQISMPMFNNQLINTVPYRNASFRYPAVGEHTLYDSVPPQPNFAVQPMSPSYPPMQQPPPLCMEQDIDIPPQLSTQSLQPSPAPWGATGSSRGEKRKHTADADEDTQEWTDYDNLLKEKKVKNKKIKLNPASIGNKIPRSGHVEQPESRRTPKGSSPPKSSKGKAAASSATQKSRSQCPKKMKAGITKEKDDRARLNESGPSQDGRRATKRARTSDSDAPSASSSRPQVAGSSDGGRLVDAADVPEFVNLTRMFRHDPKSAVKTHRFLYMVLSENQNVEEEGS